MPMRRRRTSTVDIWPGFVDALGNLLIIIIFVLLIFVLAQFFLGQTLSGREEALARLSRQISEMTTLLKLERSANEDLRTSVSNLSAQLSRANIQIDQLSQDKQKALLDQGALRDDIQSLKALKAKLERDIIQKDRLLSEGKGKLEKEERLSEQARAQAELLRQQLASLQTEMARLAEALDATEKANKEQKIQISDLGLKLNRALATKVQELQRYRSEFFGRLRALLGTRNDIRIEGDRFVFQSEVLFGTASDKLNPEGEKQLSALAKSLLALAHDIPPEITWILRVDGHTDSRPISSEHFKSNWELSAARAISVVNYLISKGVPPQRLAAAAFGEYQPLVPETNEDSMRRNRRIELKLDQR